LNLVPVITTTYTCILVLVQVHTHMTIYYLALLPTTLTSYQYSIHSLLSSFLSSWKIITKYFVITHKIESYYFFILVWTVCMFFVISIRNKIKNIENTSNGIINCKVYKSRTNSTDIVICINIMNMNSHIDIH